MTNDQVTLVQSTWAQVRPISDQAAALFYGKLFELDPLLKPLFSSDMAEQGKKLMHMITLSVHSLSKPEALLPAVQNLGRRHVGYGVKDEHYDTVGAALLWTLEKGLGEGFSPEVKEAWTATYVLLATTMKEAAAQPAAAQG
jgi:hemoglobin-like flavoprotein